MRTLTSGLRPSKPGTRWFAGEGGTALADSALSDAFLLPEAESASTQELLVQLHRDSWKSSTGWSHYLVTPPDAANFIRAYDLTFALRNLASAGSAEVELPSHRQGDVNCVAPAPAPEMAAPPQPSLEKVLEGLFGAARDEYFEDGMESSFAKGLASLVDARRETDAIKELLAYWILRQKTTPSVVAEAIRCFGRLEHGPTQRYRRWLLERSLKSRSSVIRDAAALGLASMDDREAAPALREAIQVEPIAELRQDMQQVLDQLEE